jgi:hypothetical protein
MSCDLDPTCYVAEAAKEAIGTGLGMLAESAAGSAEWALEELTTAWLSTPSPDVQASDSAATWLSAHLAWLVLAVMVGSILIAGAKLALTRRFDHVQDLAAALTRVLLVSLAAGMLTAAGVELGDAFTEWILAEADLDVQNMVVLEPLLAQPFIVLILGLVVILAQIIQLLLMLARNAMVLLLVGVLPVAAAASNTTMGRQWWSKAVAWLIAWVLYKPVAAVIYAASFEMASEGQDVATQLAGLMSIILALFALPALLRFLVPATTAMASGNAGAMAAGMVGAGVATGAVMATGGAAAVSLTGGYSSAGLTGPTGAPGAPGGSSAAGGGGTPGPGGGRGPSGPAGSPGGDNGVTTQTTLTTSNSGSEAHNGTPTGATTGSPNNATAASPTSATPTSTASGSTGSSPTGATSSPVGAAQAAHTGAQAGHKTSDAATGAVGEDGTT